MSLSRRQLYALGETLGAGASRVVAGRVILGDGGGGSSSSSSSSTTTNTTDKRMVVDQGVGVSSDSSTVTVNTLDAGIVTKALDTVAAADATSGAGLTQLLTLADKLFTTGASVLQKQSDATLAQVGALNTVANDQKGAIDQKTIVILAAAGLGALALSKKRG